MSLQNTLPTSYLLYYKCKPQPFVAVPLIIVSKRRLAKPMILSSCICLKSSLSPSHSQSLSNGRVASSQVFAVDLDSGMNGLTEYSILSGNQGETFHIDAQSGVITANGVLDYELTSSYRSVLDSDPFAHVFCLLRTELLLWPCYGLLCKIRCKMCRRLIQPVVTLSIHWRSLSKCLLFGKGDYTRTSVSLAVLSFCEFLMLLNTKWETFKKTVFAKCLLNNRALCNCLLCF